MTVGINRDNVTIVLQRPRYPENIGSVARAMCNMGFSRLRVVDPGIWDEERIRRLATHSAGAIVNTVQHHDSLPSALAPFQYVIGTTARLGDQRPVINSPETLAENLIPLSHANTIAIVFGPEDRGLTQEDLKYCHQLVTIPTVNFSSLNLAQAVMVICYCLSTASRPALPAFTPRLAKREELDRLYAELTDALVEIGYVNPENPDYWMSRIRRFLTRLSLRAGEAGIIRGICQQIHRYGRRRYAEGEKTGNADTHHHEGLP